MQTLLNYHAQNNSQLPAKTRSNCHLTGFIDVTMMEESRFKMIYFCKMIYLFTVLKQVPTVVTVKL